jgi:hypothetical protein
MLAKLVRIYRDAAGNLCAVENNTGKMWALKPDKVIGDVGDKSLKFVGKLEIPDEVA